MVRAVPVAAAMAAVEAVVVAAGTITMSAARVVQATQPGVWVVVEAVLRMILLPVAPVARRDCRVVELRLWLLRAQERAPAKVVVRKTALLTGSAPAVEAEAGFMVQQH
jgi:hypothetical protein